MISAATAEKIQSNLLDQYGDNELGTMLEVWTLPQWGQLFRRSDIGDIDMDRFEVQDLLVELAELVL